MRTDDPAFPFEYSDDGCRLTHTGMTMRDYFAGQVLAGQWVGRFPEDVYPITAKRVAEACYEIADAMLEARKEPKDAPA